MTDSEQLRETNARLVAQQEDWLAEIVELTGKLRRIHAILVEALGGEGAIPDGIDEIDVARAVAGKLKLYATGVRSNEHAVNRLRREMRKGHQL